MVEFFATGGAGAVKSLASGAARVVPRLVTELPAVIDDVARSASALAGQARTAVSTATTAIRTGVDDAANYIRNLNWADDTGSVNFTARRGPRGVDATGESAGAVIEGSSKAQPRNALGQFTSGAGGESAATAAGRSAHASYPNTLGWSSTDDVAFNQAMRGTNLRPEGVLRVLVTRAG